MKTMTLAIAAALLAGPALAQTPAPAAGELPYCSAKITDSCQQTAAQQARAMSGEQADKRDARNGGQWTPNNRATTTTTTTKTTTTKPQ